MKSWHLRLGLAHRPFAVVEEPEESAQRPSKARRLLKRVHSTASTQSGRSGVGQSPKHAPQPTPGQIHPRVQSSGSDDVGTTLAEVAVSSDEVPLSQPPWFGDSLTMVHNDFCQCPLCFGR